MFHGLNKETEKKQEPAEGAYSLHTLSYPMAPSAL